MVLPSGQSFMELNTGKSWSWDVNFLEYGLGFGTSYAGLVTGMGFEFTNYVFEGQNNIVKDPVSGDMVAYVPDYADNITKSKLNITYLTAPLLLEFQIPAGKKRIHLSGGVIGGVKLASNSKLKYTENGDKSKEKFKGNFNLSPLRWGVTARAGYRSLNLFATYYMTPLFIPGSEPELYPFSVGLTLTPF
ncbi:MAG: outer membrane beta-barrel protein [Bacteroidales bacterium]